jgi:hypothetical protein
MQAVTAIRLDIAKSVFHVHGVDAGGKIIMPTVEASLRGGFFR